MGVEDIITAGKVASKLDEAADAAKAAKVATKVSDLPRVKFPYKGVEYSFPPGTTREDAIRFLWKSGIGPGKKGEVVDLPSELPIGRQRALSKDTVGPAWDPAGMGSVPVTNQDFEYLGGFERKMTPSTFLSHAHKEPNLLTDTNAQSLRQGLKEGKKMAPPALWAKWDDEEKVWRVTSHEGRHRSSLVREQYGDVDMPVRILPTDEYGTYLRGKVTDEMRKAPIVGVGAAAIVATGAEDKPKSNVIPFPKKLEPGIYVDEDTGKYFKIDKDGNMEPINEAP